ncbi:sensor protein ResE [Bacillus sp. JCM 19046]|nr:sensor protein ResE [Bacillus sp. JCM 19045]GAF16222.1 sensor protein ResE [Bacillus sp. JCM 19046]
MLRNRQFVRSLIGMSMVAVIGTTLAFFISIEAGLVTAGTVLLVISINVYQSTWRYREIGKLSSYLRKIGSSKETFDLSDHEEGELSILKSEIYKVTKLLSEQSFQLNSDKTKLADAIGDISHQLKTPLTSMTVMADLLADPNLPVEKRKEFTKSLTLQLERIDWLVSSLLKLSKMDAGTIVFKKETVQVSALIEEVIEPLRISMELKNQTLQLEGREDLQVIGDFHWIKEALINIVKNAVEHTPANGLISLTYDENALFTEIIVTDSGKGIPRQELPHLFKRFYRGKDAGRNSVGIGLAMAQSIITNQNGIIEVIPNELGTSFRVKLYKSIRK